MTKEIWKCVPKVVKVADLKPYENNARDNNPVAVNAVVESIKRHGYQERILVDKDMVIIRGHTRLKAFQKLGWNEVEVLMAEDMTAEQARTARLIDNRTQELSMVKAKEMDLELRELADLDYARALGFVEVKEFGEDDFKTTDEDIKAEQKRADTRYTEAEEKKQEGMLAIPCPHCTGKFMMRRKDLFTKVLIKKDEEYYNG